MVKGNKVVKGNNLMVHNLRDSLVKNLHNIKLDNRDNRVNKINRDRKALQVEV